MGFLKSSGRVFAWAKATEGTGFVDADFYINITNAQAAGVLIGRRRWTTVTFSPDRVLRW